MGAKLIAVLKIVNLNVVKVLLIRIIFINVDYNNVHINVNIVMNNVYFLITPMNTILSINKNKNYN